MAAAVTERQLQEAVLETARLFGWLAYHTFDSRRSAAGFPDLVLVRAARLLFVELKTGRGQRSPAQHLWAEQLVEVELRGEHVGYRLWTPGDWQSGLVEQELRAR